MIASLQTKEGRRTWCKKLRISQFGVANQMVLENYEREEIFWFDFLAFKHSDIKRNCMGDCFLGNDTKDSIWLKDIRSIGFHQRMDRNWFASSISVKHGNGKNKDF